jgi:tryptophan synthase alpha chain
VRRIDAIFADLRHDRRTALMPFITAGHPSLGVTAEIIPAMEAAGASIVEVGVPFSDPIADGPVIAGAMHEALKAGVTPARVFETIASIRNRTTVGLVAMVSDSIVTRMGERRFLADAAAAGFDGVIIPDIDLGAAEAVGSIASEHGMTLSLLAAPTTPPTRLARIAALSSGFVYLLARAGTTGESDAAPQIERQVTALRELTDLPIAVGFGIATPEHVAAVTAAADAAIVGSALVRRMGEARDPVAAAAAFIRELAVGLKPAAVRA